MELTPIEVFFDGMRTFFDSVRSWLEFGIFELVEQNPVFAIFLFGMPIVGFVVGLFRRLKNA